MKRKLRILSLLVFSTTVLSSCYLDLGFIQIGEKPAEQEGSEEKGSEEQKEGNYLIIPQEQIDAYYASVGSETGNELLSKLNSIIDTSDVSVSYDWSRYSYAYEDPFNSDKVLLVYARKSMFKSKTNSGGNTGWNKEHTYPKSKMDNEQAKSDNHIIFASDCIVNKARSNYQLGYITGGSIVKDSLGKETTCRVDSSKFDPCNEARGVVARATMYAAAMYGFSPTVNIESLETMLKWHLDYPVTKFDQSRNNKVHNRQKNRNPFVDHPEYACKIWGTANAKTRQVCGL